MKKLIKNVFLPIALMVVAILVIGKRIYPLHIGQQPSLRGQPRLGRQHIGRKGAIWLGRLQPKHYRVRFIEQRLLLLERQQLGVVGTKKHTIVGRD